MSKLSSSSHKVRLDEDGQLDELVVFDEDGQCTFHLEKMRNGRWWFSVTPSGESKRYSCHLTVQDLHMEDEFTDTEYYCVKD